MVNGCRWQQILVVEIFADSIPVDGAFARATVGKQANGSAALSDTKAVDSVCPFCGVGCQLTFHVAAPQTPTERIVRVEGRRGPANASRLCVKGRFGFDYANHPQRLTRPLIRRADDKGVFVMLDAALPTRLLTAFPPGVEVVRCGLKEAVEGVRAVLEEGRADG